MASSEDALERYWGKIKKSRKCWEWEGSLDSYGYGMLSFRPQRGCRKVNLMVHQIAYFLKHLSIPAGLCVCHHCDNRKCVNPKHLFAGTHTENIKDRDRKNRHWVWCGVQSPVAKLTERQVREARKLWDKNWTAREIAAKFGVSRGCINGVVFGTNWKQLK